MRRYSSTPSWAFSTTADLVSTTMPSLTGMVHEGMSIVPRGPFDLDQAHPAHADRLHPGVPAEPGDVDAVVLGGLDEQLSLGPLHLDAVDGDGHHV